LQICQDLKNKNCSVEEENSAEIQKES